MLSGSDRATESRFREHGPWGRAASTPFLSAARLDARFEQGGITTAEAIQWFSVPLKEIDRAIELLQAETIESYEYDPDARTIRLRGA